MTAWEGVLEGLEEPVPDHALGLGSQNVQRVRVGQRRVSSAFQGQQPDLGAVSMGDDQCVLSGQGGQGPYSRLDVVGLDLRIRWFAPLEEGVPA